MIETIDENAVIPQRQLDSSIKWDKKVEEMNRIQSYQSRSSFARSNEEAIYFMNAKVSPKTTFSFKTPSTFESFNHSRTENTILLDWKVSSAQSSSNHDPGTKSSDFWSLPWVKSQLLEEDLKGNEKISTSQFLGIPKSQEVEFEPFADLAQSRNSNGYGVKNSNINDVIPPSLCEKPDQERKRDKRMKSSPIEGSRKLEYLYIDFNPSSISSITYRSRDFKVDSFTTDDDMMCCKIENKNDTENKRSAVRHDCIHFLPLLVPNRRDESHQEFDIVEKLQPIDELGNKILDNFKFLCDSLSTQLLEEERIDKENRTCASEEKEYTCTAAVTKLANPTDQSSVTSNESYKKRMKYEVGNDTYTKDENVERASNIQKVVTPLAPPLAQQDCLNEKEDELNAESQFQTYTFSTFTSERCNNPFQHLCDFIFELAFTQYLLTLCCEISHDQNEAIDDKMEHNYLQDFGPFELNDEIDDEAIKNFIEDKALVNTRLHEVEVRVPKTQSSKAGLRRKMSLALKSIRTRKKYTNIHVDDEAEMDLREKSTGSPSDNLEVNTKNSISKKNEKLDIQKGSATHSKGFKKVFILLRRQSKPAMKRS